MILGIPVIDQQGLTQQCIRSLTQTVSDPTHFTVVIIDNNSDTPYKEDSYKDLPFQVFVLKNKKNKGYYYPLLDLYNRFPEEFVGLVHNDIIFYEKGWDVRLTRHFQGDPKLGLVGLCGSNQVDRLGGRGAGTMCFFRGEKGQPQSAGKKITDLQPACILDSLFMMFRRIVIPSLKIDEKIAPCHFYDKIWSLRTIEAGYRVGGLGSEVDHIGGMTACGIEKFKKDSEDWLNEMGIKYDKEKIDPRTAVYDEAERRFLTEYRQQKLMIPGIVNPYYDFISLA